MNPKYRTILVAPMVAVLALAVGCGSDDNSGGSTANQSGAAAANAPAKSLSIGAQGEFNIMQVHVAKEKGFLKENGISDVKVTNFTDLPAMTAAISRGQVDMGFQAPTLLQAFNTQSKASKFKFFAPGVKTTNAFLAKNDSGIPVTSGADWQPTVRAWQGKTIGVPALGGLVEAYVRYLGNEAGIDGKKLDVVAVGVGPAALAALKAGKADVVGGDALTTESVVNGGVGQIVLNLVKDQGPEILNDNLSAGYFAPEDRIAKDRATYAGLAKAIQEAQAYMLDPAHKAEVEQIMTSSAKLPPALAKSVVDNELEVFDASLSRDTVDKTINTLSTVGALPGPKPAYADLVANLGS
jgi:ABC-type nitrate/sulfonate/bicarbonate transport system substrate-binding protein